jgi:hypothetical protein
MQLNDASNITSESVGRAQSFPVHRIPKSQTQVTGYSLLVKWLVAENSQRRSLQIIDHINGLG